MSILLVEDNELNTEIAQTLLEHDGALVTTAANGKEALELFQAKPAGAFDAILMDVMMPEMNGYEATRAIRLCDKPDAADVPIIAMTANAFIEDIARAQGVRHERPPVQANRDREAKGHASEVSREVTGARGGRKPSAPGARRARNDSRVSGLRACRVGHFGDVALCVQPTYPTRKRTRIDSSMASTKEMDGELPP